MAVVLVAVEPMAAGLVAVVLVAVAGGWVVGTRATAVVV